MQPSPLSFVPPAPNTTPTSQQSGWQARLAPHMRLLAIAGLALVLLSLIFGVANHAAAESAHAQAVQLASVVSTQARTIAADTQRIQAGAYTTVAYRDYGRIESAAASAGSDCTNNLMSACLSDYQTLDGDIHTMQQDLAGASVPACLKGADTALRAGLALLDTGAQQAIASIQQSSMSLATTSAATVAQAGTSLATAKAALANPHC